MKIFKKLLPSIRSKISTNQRIIESGVEGGGGNDREKIARQCECGRNPWNTGQPGK